MQSLTTSATIVTFVLLLFAIITYEYDELIEKRNKNQSQKTKKKQKPKKNMNQKPTTTTTTIADHDFWLCESSMRR